MLPLEFINRIDLDDIGMIQGGGTLRFTFESLDKTFILGQMFAKHLEGNKTIEAIFVGFVDDTHAATPQFGDN